MSRWPCPCGTAVETEPHSRWTHPAVLVLALAASTVSWSCSLDNPVRATREFATSASAEAVSRIEVHNRVGTIRVKGYDGTDVRVGVLVKVRAASDERAEALAEKVQVHSATDGDTLKFTSVLPDLRLREQIEVELDVSVPWRQAGGEASAAATPAAGRAVVCEMVVGQVKVCGLPVAVRAELTTGTIAIEEVTGPVDVESGTGTVKIRQVADKVTVTAGTGTYTIAEVRGPVRISAATGRIDIRDIKPRQAAEPPTPAVSAHIATGFICIRDVSGNVEATTDTGRVKVTDVRGTVNAHSTVGEVEQEQVKAPR